MCSVEVCAIRFLASPPTPNMDPSDKPPKLKKYLGHNISYSKRVNKSSGLKTSNFVFEIISFYVQCKKIATFRRGVNIDSFTQMTMN